MSLNPLTELKRRLHDETTPLPKRLCLAKNLVLSHHFPTAPKERVIAEWLAVSMKNNILTGGELRNVLDWLKEADDLTNELKGKLIKIVSQYVKKNPLEKNDIQYILAFLENDKMTSQLNNQVDDYLRITTTLLESLINDEGSTCLCQRIFNNLIKYYKESKKKLEFIIKLIQDNNLEAVFSYLDTEYRSHVIEVCRVILFPLNKKTFFISYLQTLIRKDNLDELIAEKGDNIQSVLKIMDIFLQFPQQRSDEDPKFLKDFIDVFVSCFCKESQVVFAFYIVTATVLGLKQSYITPSMHIEAVNIDKNYGKTKRNLFLGMLEIVLQNEVDISVRLTDTFGEKISKVETKKTFMSFIQAVMMGQLKLEGKPDKVTLQIIKVALKLDPSLIEQKVEEIIPPLMTMKKSSTNNMESYIEMLNSFLEILFKLSRGTLFISQILPFIKNNLEACNTEQLELRKKVKELEENAIDCEKVKSKILTGNDVFPKECVETYGRLTADLMFRQNKELLESLRKDFEEYCLIMLEEGFGSPSITIMAEVISAILSSFLRHSKMADHTVPQNIAEDFWLSYSEFEDKFMKKYGECLAKHNYNKSLLVSFLNLCLSFAQLKLLNIKYSNIKVKAKLPDNALDVFDLNVILPCLTSEQWNALASNVQDDEAVILLDQLILVKTMAIQVLNIQNNRNYAHDSTEDAKTYLIKQLNTNPEILALNYYENALFFNLDGNQCKQLAKCLIKMYLNDHTEVLNNSAVNNNRLLLNSLVLEAARNVTKCLGNCENLTKALGKIDFNMATFAKETNMTNYFQQINNIECEEDTLKKYINLLKKLQIPYLEENYQLTAVIILLALKKCCQSKKIKRNIDLVLQTIYELSPHYPDISQIFPVDFIFNFDDNFMIDLLTLKIKTSNQLLIIKSILEMAVRKVRVDSELVKNIVQLLLKKSAKKASSLESFSDPTFQISCTILPLIVKQKKSITNGAFRSILADLQEKLHKALLKSFKNVNFTNGSLFSNSTNLEDSVVESEANMAALNAIAAYSLTLSRYCETSDVEEIKNLDCLWSGLEYFIQNAMKSIQCPESKSQHVESSVQLLNVTLRHIKKLDAHNIFKDKNKLFTDIWKALLTRLHIIYGKTGKAKISSLCIEDVAVTLKFICELSSVECFDKVFVADLSGLAVLKNPTKIIKDDSHIDLTTHKVSLYLWAQCLKANIIAPKCAAMTRQIYQNSRNLRSWIRQHYDTEVGHASDSVASKKKRKVELYNNEDGEINVRVLKVEDEICEIVKVDLDTLAEVIFAAKKITIDYKLLDSIFELQHMVHHIIGRNTTLLRCEVSWQAFFKLFEGCIAVLNSLLMAREEILEDRWPCYTQCYRALVSSLCERASSRSQLEKPVEERLAEVAHSIEKLTQSICKRKKQVSRIATYVVADLCSALESTAPSKMVRQHLENSVALLIQVSDSTYAMAFLKRALVGLPGQMTMTNLYTMYKRYHKYVGNA